jgi:hypothetical protein
MDARGLGLYRALNRLRLDQVLDRRVRFVTATTQNPKVERGIRSVLDEFVDLGRLEGWTVDSMLLPGFYGQLLVPHQPDTTGTPLPSVAG